MEGLGLLIFIAIMLHKAPAAIGFGTFLHHEGLANKTLVKHLFVNIILFNSIGFHSDMSIGFSFSLFWISLV